MEIFLVRTAQSFLCRCTDRKTSRQLAERLVRFTLENHDEMAADYGTTDEFDLVERVTKDFIAEGWPEAD